ncbi:MAG: hypothetical protein AAFR87_30875, partial [Bacteroidota bacterium]
MPTYKESLHQGFAKRGFEIIQINKDPELLPWWMEEIWIIRNKAGKSLLVNFLTDKLWQNGKKRVEVVGISTSELRSYQDTDQLLVLLDMRKG